MTYLFVLSVLVKGLVVLGVALALGLMLRRASAAVRHGIWVAAFVALLALPVLEMTGPKWTVPFELASPASAVDVAPMAPAFVPQPPVPPRPPAPPAPPPPPPPPGVLAYGADMERHAADLERHAERLERHAERIAERAERDAERQLDQLHRQMEAAERRIEREVAVFETVSHARPHTIVVTPGSVVTTIQSIPRELILAVLWFWGLGALAVGLAWAVAYAAAARAVRLGVPEANEDILATWERVRILSGITRPVRLLRSPALDVPIAWGWGHAAVVLPPSAEGWDEDRLEAVLLHELAHVLRGDAFSQLVAQVALVMHWANPLAWLAYRRFLLEREHACDDVVLEHGARPSAYADHLVQVARDLRRRSAALAAVAPMARRSNLEGRVLSILDPARKRSALGRAAALTLALMLAGVVLPLAAFQPVAACQPVASCEAEPEPAAPVVVASSMLPLALPEIELDAPDPDDQPLVDAEDIEPAAWSDELDLSDALDVRVVRFGEGDAHIELAARTREVPDDLRLALDTIPDFDDIIRPALERALSAVRAMRRSPEHRQLGLTDDDWDEMEEEIRESIDDAREDYREAIEDAIEEARESRDGDWEVYGSRSAQAAIRAMQAERQQAMAHARLEIDRAAADAKHTIHDAERQRSEARRQSTRNQRDAAREAARAQAYAYRMSDGDVRVTVSGPNAGADVWIANLDNLDYGLDGIEAALDALDDDSLDADVMAGLRGGLAGIEGGLEGIRSGARSAVNNDRERRKIDKRAARVRKHLRALQERLDDCDD